MSLPVWINGRTDTCIDPADRGLAYGDGLFETFRIAQGRAVLADLHFERLGQSAKTLGIALDIDSVQQSFSQFLVECPAECVTKIIVTRGVAGRGYLPDSAAAPTVVFSAHPLPSLSERGMTVGVASLKLGIQPALAGHKHLNRLEQVLLRQEQAQARCDGLECDELLVCDASNNVVEGVSSNIFFIKDDVLCTPCIDQCGVNGVARKALLAYARENAISVKEGCYPLNEVVSADNIFFCNSVVGIRPVHYSRHEGKAYRWETGQITQQLLTYWQTLLK